MSIKIDTIKSGDNYIYIINGVEKDIAPGIGRELHSCSRRSIKGMKYDETSKVLRVFTTTEVNIQHILFRYLGNFRVSETIDSGLYDNYEDFFDAIVESTVKKTSKEELSIAQVYENFKEGFEAYKKKHLYFMNKMDDALKHLTKYEHLYKLEIAEESIVVSVYLTIDGGSYYELTYSAESGEITDTRRGDKCWNMDDEITGFIGDVLCEIIDYIHSPEFMPTAISTNIEINKFVTAYFCYGVVASLVSSFDERFYGEFNLSFFGKKFKEGKVRFKLREKDDIFESGNIYFKTSFERNKKEIFDGVKLSKYMYSRNLAFQEILFKERKEVKTKVVKEVKEVKEEATKSEENKKEPKKSFLKRFFELVI